jgi:hypothetical protein
MHAVCSFSGRSRLSQQPPTLSVPQFLVEPEPGVSQGRPTRVASRFASSLAQLHPAESSLRADPSWDSIVTDWQFTSSCSPRTHYCAAVTFSHRPGELRPGRDSHPAMLVRFTVALAWAVSAHRGWRRSPVTWHLTPGTWHLPPTPIPSPFLKPSGRRRKLHLRITSFTRSSLSLGLCLGLISSCRCRERHGHKVALRVAFGLPFA